MQTPSVMLGGSHLQRLPGSRGQTTVALELPAVNRPVWWIFNFGKSPVPVVLAGEGRSLEVGGRCFRTAETDSGPA